MDSQSPMTFRSQNAKYAPSHGTNYTKVVLYPGFGFPKNIPCSAAHPCTDKHMSTDPRDENVASFLTKGRHRLRILLYSITSIDFD